MEELNSYLNDHLAGSVGALELLDRLIDIYQEKPIERFFRELRSEIEADQEVLKRLIASLGQEESAVRKAGAWVMEKLSRAKIQPGEERRGGVGTLFGAGRSRAGHYRQTGSLARVGRSISHAPAASFAGL